MKIVIAPDKFKGCLSAIDVARAVAAGVRKASPECLIDECPMADGGEGTVAALVAATGGRTVRRTVTGPLPEMRIAAPIGLLGDGRTAVIEMASASGLALLRPEQRNPMNTTTYGTGELLLAAAEMGAKKIILGIGGSATTDGGLGCAQACGGLPVLSEDGEPMKRPIVGADLGRFRLQVWDDRFTRHGVEVVVACDVDNPLAGPRGAAHVYGPQKGATAEQVLELDAGLAHLAAMIPSVDSKTPGAGAAGGLGFGLLAFFGARLQSGIDIVIEATKLQDRMDGAALCITGEGRLDEQSLQGKTPVGVARVCREKRIPCIALAGSAELDGPAADAARAEGLTAWFSIVNRPLTLDEAMGHAADLLAATAGNVVRAFMAQVGTPRGRSSPSSPTAPGEGGGAHGEGVARGAHRADRGPGS